ncbi:oligosaccharide flippase family protein [uncultured Cytophaga sp.]|uniref:oligosaccharide flippase family protein n=1 Tax=uncultured Cytophaga sp. TaxID=160238 RepID=UPI00261A66D1|nr:oligosaccharide flippase family protein [uncultured Cytophaga sp.]
MSRVRSAVMGVLSSQFFMIINIFLALWTTPLYLDILGKEGYGLYTVIIQLIAYVYIMDLGLSAGITRELAGFKDIEKEENRIAINHVVSTSFFVYVLIGILSFAVVLLAMPYVPMVFDIPTEFNGVLNDILISYGVFMLINFPLKAIAGIFYAHQRQVLSNTLGFISNLISIVLPLILLITWKEIGLWAFVIANGLNIFISVAINVYFILKHYPFLKIRFQFFKSRVFKEMFRFGMYTFLIQLAVQVVFQTDRILVGSLVSLSAVSIYAITLRLPELCLQTVFRVTNSSFPALVERFKNNATQDMALIHNKLMLLQMTIIVCAVILIGVLDKPFIELWIGANFFSGWGVLGIYIVLMVLLTMSNVSAVCLNSSGDIKSLSVWAILEAILNLGLSLYLGRKYGIIGIIAATLFASAITTSWFIPYKTMKTFNIPTWDYLKPVLIPIAYFTPFAGVCYIGAKYYFEYVGGNWLSIIIFGLIIGMVLMFFAWFVVLRKEFLLYIPEKIRRKYKFI